MKSAWKRLAEGLGIQGEANWDAAAKRRNMQRYGTQDRRTQTGPTPYFKPNGMGAAQRQSTTAAMSPSMTPRKGGLQIPAGTDRPGQGNPLMAPPKKTATTPLGQPSSPLTTAPNSPQGIQHQQGQPDNHQMNDEDWLNQLGDDDEEM